MSDPTLRKLAPRTISPSDPGLTMPLSIAALIAVRLMDDFETRCAQFDQHGERAGVYVFPKEAGDSDLDAQMRMVSTQPLPPMAVGMVLLALLTGDRLMNGSPKDENTREVVEIMIGWPKSQDTAIRDRIREVVNGVVRDVGISAVMMRQDTHAEGMN